MRIRKPAVAGQFYPDSATQLRAQIEGFADKKTEKLEVIACILPHAGYTYSARVAVNTVSAIKIKEKIILLGPNHTGRGVAFSLMADGAWQTPLGSVKIDQQLAGMLLKHSRYLEADTLAHQDEHSLEVELPILQYFRPDFQIVPIAISAQDPAVLKQIGRDIALAIKESGIQDSILIVASSDMTHYEPQAQAEEKDRRAIEAIIRLDEDGLTAVIHEYDISMCGYAPVSVMLGAAKLLGAKTGKLIKYQTSADSSGDKSSVVGYAGMVIY